MYVPDMFAEWRPDALHALVRAHPLGALVRLGKTAWRPTTCRSSWS
jgi:predicted FMN-binding regulatory protein PaiB